MDDIVFFDSETCGLHGMMVLLQWAEGEGPINLVDVWKQPVQDTLETLEYIASKVVCGFNLAFDWFHVAKLWSTFSLFRDKYGSDAIPEDYISEIANLEKQARFYDYVIKPKKAID